MITSKNSFSFAKMEIGRGLLSINGTNGCARFWVTEITAICSYRRILCGSVETGIGLGNLECTGMGFTAYVVEFVEVS